MRLIPILLSLVLFCGCASLQMPERVLNRTAYTSFNPAGRWSATGEFLHRPSNGTVIEVTAPPPGKQFFTVTRSAPGQAKVSGIGLVEGDVLYVAYGAGSFVLYSLGPENGSALVLEGIWGDDKLGYERGTSEYPGYGDRFGRTWAIEGLNPSGSTYTGEFSISKEGDHYALETSSGKSDFKGAGFLFENRLVGSMLNTRRESVSYNYRGMSSYETTTVTTRDAVFAVAAYKWDGSKLTGLSLVNSTKWGDRTASFQEKKQPESWSRVDTQAAQ